MWIGADDAESLKALERAIDLGLNFIDTALAYGDGHSEELVGQVVRGARETVHVATKIPPRNMRWPASPEDRAEAAFPGDHIRACTERSLRNLGLETIDVQQFHVWHDDWLEQGDWLETVEALKQEGKIRCFGVSINDHAPETALALVRSGHVDTVQVIYNVFDQARSTSCSRSASSTASACSPASPSTRAASRAGSTPTRRSPTATSATTTSTATAAARSPSASARSPTTSARPWRTCPSSPCATSSPSPPSPPSSRACARSATSSATCAAGDGRGLPAEQVATLKQPPLIRNWYR